MTKGGFKSEETREFFRCQNKYSKSLSWAENLNFPPKTVNNLFKFSAQDSDLEYLFWQRKNSSVSSDLKQPLADCKPLLYYKLPYSTLHFNEIFMLFENLKHREETNGRKIHENDLGDKKKCLLTWYMNGSLESNRSGNLQLLSCVGFNVRMQNWFLHTCIN